MVLGSTQDDAGLGDHRVVYCVDFADAVETAQAEYHLAAIADRYGARDQTRVASLRDYRNVMSGADLNNSRDVGCVGRQQHCFGGIGDDAAPICLEA